MILYGKRVLLHDIFRKREIQRSCKNTGGLPEKGLMIR